MISVVFGSFSDFISIFYIFLYYLYKKYTFESMCTIQVGNLFPSRHLETPQVECILCTPYINAQARFGN